MASCQPEAADAVGHEVAERLVAAAGRQRRVDEPHGACRGPARAGPRPARRCRRGRAARWWRSRRRRSTRRRPRPRCERPRTRSRGCRGTTSGCRRCRSAARSRRRPPRRRRAPRSCRSRGRGRSSSTGGAPEHLGRERRLGVGDHEACRRPASSPSTCRGLRRRRGDRPARGRRRRSASGSPTESSTSAPSSSSSATSALVPSGSSDRGSSGGPSSGEPWSRRSPSSPTPIGAGDEGAARRRHQTRTASTLRVELAEALGLGRHR